MVLPWHILQARLLDDFLNPLYPSNETQKQGGKTMETASTQTTEPDRIQIIDPREAKLSEIIEKGKASLHKTLEEIQHEFSIREDMVVRPAAIDFLVRGHKIQPLIRDEAYDLTDHSQGQMLNRAGIPAQFAQKLMDLEENELLSRNLKRLTERMEDGGILLRRVGTTIKGWLSPAYKRMDAAPIMEAFLKRSLDKGFVPYRGMNTDYRYQVSMIQPRIWEPVPGEFVVFGTSLVTGDYGNQSLEIDLLMLRIVCLNLAIGHDLFRKIHLGSRFQMGEGDEIVPISQKTINLDTDTISSAVTDVVNASETHIKLLEHKIQEASAKEIRDPKSIYDSLRKRGLRKETVERIKTAYDLPREVEILPKGNNLWRLSNAISLVANGIERPDEKVDLEKEAMNILMA
jgi:hypothetical protein